MVKERGFTLLEIMVVMVIIALITGLAIPTLMNALHDSKVDATRAQLRVLKQAVGLYQMDIGRPPTQSEGLEALLEPPAGYKRYLDAVELPTDAWGRAFEYYEPGQQRAEYSIASNGADGARGGLGRDEDLYIHGY